MASKKMHYRLSIFVGACGHQGDTTSDKSKVTCKLCKKLIKASKYPH